MKISRYGKHRNHGLRLIASTKRFEASVSEQGLDDDHDKRVIEVILEVDHEQSGNGNHNHHVTINANDFVILVNTVAQQIAVDKKLRDQIADCFDGNITSLEKIKIEVLNQENKIR